MKFNWVSLKVSDLDKSVAFYKEMLNLEIAEKFGNGNFQIVMLGKAQEPKVELIYDPQGKVENPGKGVSIGFEIDDLDGLVDALKKSGKDVIGPRIPNEHIRYFFVKDPDGYNIQLVEQK